MNYLGGKATLAKHILPIILKDRKPGQWYVEPFAGGMNVVDKVKGNRIASDAHPQLIAMWKALVEDGWTPPGIISKDEYRYARDNRSMFDDYYLGWVGFCCAFNGAYFNSYAGNVSEKYRNKNGKLRNYQEETKNAIMRQIPKLKNVIFNCSTYDKLSIPPESIVYCDPPYKGTTGYSVSLDHDAFWQWCREQSKAGHSVFISEYNAPSDFKCIYEKLKRYGTKCKSSTERLFVYPWLTNLEYIRHKQLEMF